MIPDTGGQFQQGHDGDAPPDDRDARDAALHQNLRAAARRTILRHSPPVPPALRRQIEALPAVTTKTATERRPAFRWLPAAAAAVLALAATALVRFAISQKNQDVTLASHSGKTPPQPSQWQVPVALASAATDVHRHCSAMKNHFVDRRFPRDLRALPGPAREFFGGRYAGVPDLTAIGYEFAGAAPCPIPGGKTLHVLYRSIAHPTLHLSVFLQAYTGQITIDDDKAYTAAGSENAPPMVVWRTDDLIYYLVGDVPGAVQQTAGRMGIPVKL